MLVRRFSFLKEREKIFLLKVVMIENSGKIGEDNCYSKFMGYKNSRFCLLIIYL